MQCPYKGFFKHPIGRTFDVGENVQCSSAEAFAVYHSRRLLDTWVLYCVPCPNLILHAPCNKRECRETSLHRRWTCRPGIIDITTSQRSYPEFRISRIVIHRNHLLLKVFSCKYHYPCMPNPGSIPACFNAFAFRESTSFFCAFCEAAKLLTTSSSANFAPLGCSSRSRSTVAHMVTFSPRIVITPGSLTSCISQRGMEGSEEGVASGLRAAIRS
jgi:hypothetical protein